MHLPPNVDYDFMERHFQDVPDGIVEWILNGINSPKVDFITYDSVSSLMEFAAYIGMERLSWRDE